VLLYNPSHDSAWPTVESKQQTWTKQSLSRRNVCIGCQLNSDQALRLLCFEGYVRERGSTLWQNHLQEASEFLCTKKPLWRELSNKKSPTKTEMLSLTRYYWHVFKISRLVPQKLGFIDELIIEVIRGQKFWLGEVVFFIGRFVQIMGESLKRWDSKTSLFASLFVHRPDFPLVFLIASFTMPCTQSLGSFFDTDHTQRGEARLGMTKNIGGRQCAHGGARWPLAFMPRKLVLISRTQETHPHIFVIRAGGSGRNIAWGAKITEYCVQ